MIVHYMLESDQMPVIGFTICNNNDDVRLHSVVRSEDNVRGEYHSLRK